jgi:hypothetical protein
MTEEFSVARFLASLLFLAVMGGCSSDLNGTWLFQWDLGSIESTSRDVCPPLDQKTYEGEEYEWIDIYTTTGGALVLSNGSEEWVGTTSGDSFSVSSTYGEGDGSFYTHRGEEITGQLVDEELSGRSDEYQIECDSAAGCESSDDECRRQTRRRFTASKIEGTTDPTRTIAAPANQSDPTQE